MKRVLIAIVRFYQLALSPLKGRGVCRFHPTCSQYFIDAVRIHGSLKGSVLGIWRVLRCNPFGSPGYDPVPEKHPRQTVPREGMGMHPARAATEAAPETAAGTRDGYGSGRGHGSGEAATS
ncbi:MAG: membrane protein insertion efficiency factor YidD [Planctomycetota bacterium]